MTIIAIGSKSHSVSVGGTGHDVMVVSSGITSWWMLCWMLVGVPAGNTENGFHGRGNWGNPRT